MTGRNRFLWILAITTACAEPQSEGSPAVDPRSDGAAVGLVTTNDASTLGDASAQLDAGAPLGLYHLPSHGEVVNLRIDADGTFRYLLAGGDFGSAELGRWSAEGAVTALLPRAGRARFWWVGMQTRIVEKVLVRAGVTEDELISIAENALGREEQTWKRGGSCRRSEPNAVNGVPFRREPCDDPFGAYDFTVTNGEPLPDAL